MPGRPNAFYNGIKDADADRVVTSCRGFSDDLEAFVDDLGPETEG